MPQDTTEHLQLTFVNGVAVISITTHYLQAEDVIETVGEELLELVEKWECTKVLLTFEGVRFVSSSMLAQVMKLHKRLAKTKGHLRICGLNPMLRDVLRASQLDRLLEVYDDDKLALTKF
ncbi:STAS domain-containing protein [Singulisphaera acidiphila]|uniref:Anti-anti-sigma regulatory factor (Antagonist of anti-sigma factor) n=1 Tax=Singulisphaera acidiphila (strain ATCC BAA-1392 / DSM 18658 / VKM B-2454 / MOB10) TaxID=886293 RepID=L0DR04_SINAD|nr:STAS domain-containing protein [Singulisphaera acidiphila]AGA31430.1 anti-anti-sigma regulatory factor (antagonist of anti-sigma factor) [Singulisphaera acidiphila DSM 18658]